MTAADQKKKALLKDKTAKIKDQMKAVKDAATAACKAAKDKAAVKIDTLKEKMHALKVVVPKAPKAAAPKKKYTKKQKWIAPFAEFQIDM